MSAQHTTKCPKCGHESTRTDSCEACGALINRIKNRQHEGSAPSAAGVAAENFEGISYSPNSYASAGAGSFFKKAMIGALLLAGVVFGMNYLGGGKGGPTSASVHEYNQSAFVANVEKGSKDQVWVVDFWASWCGPCKQFAPEFIATAEKMSPAMSFAKVDVDAATEVAQRYGIDSIPRVVMFRGGKVIAQTGGLDRDGLEQWIEANN